MIQTFSPAVAQRGLPAARPAAPGTHRDPAGRRARLSAREMTGHRIAARALPAEWREVFHRCDVTLAKTRGWLT